jgi:hypothetical protein
MEREIKENPKKIPPLHFVSGTPFFRGSLMKTIFSLLFISYHSFILKSYYSLSKAIYNIFIMGCHNNSFPVKI